MKKTARKDQVKSAAKPKKIKTSDLKKLKIGGRGYECSDSLGQVAKSASN